MPLSARETAVGSALVDPLDQNRGSVRRTGQQSGRAWLTANGSAHEGGRGDSSSSPDHRVGGRAESTPRTVLALAVLVLTFSGASDIASHLETLVQTLLVARTYDERDAYDAVRSCWPDIIVVDLRAPWALTLLSRLGARRALGLAHGTKRSKVGGTATISPAMSREQIKAVLQKCTPLATRRITGARALTRQESLIASLLDRELTNRQIAGELFLAEATVKNHVHSIINKLEAHDRREAAAIWSASRVPTATVGASRAGS